MTSVRPSVLSVYLSILSILWLVYSPGNYNSQDAARILQYGGASPFKRTSGSPWDYNSHDAARVSQYGGRPFPFKGTSASPLPFEPANGSHRDYDSQDAVRDSQYGGRPPPFKRTSASRMNYNSRRAPHATSARWGLQNGGAAGRIRASRGVWPGAGGRGLTPGSPRARPSRRAPRACTADSKMAALASLKEKKLMDVRLAELPRWLLARDFSPRGVAGAFRRGYQRYHSKYINVRRGGVSGVAMALGAYVLLSYGLSYGELKHERWRKYH